MLDRIAGIRARRALLGQDLQLVDDVWMTFERGVITRIGTGRGPSGLMRLEGDVVLPGLVDCHVHLTMDGGPDVEAALARLTRSSAEELAWRNAAAQVRTGVTTVRDLGSLDHLLVDLAGQFSAPGALSPSLLAAGAISRPGGHGHFISTITDGVHGYAAATRHLLTRGARAIKVFATGGVITSGSLPGGVQMSDAELAAVVETAHAAGIPVAAHAHGAQGVANAIRTGVDSVEHFSYLEAVDTAHLLTSRTRLVTTLVATERFATCPDRHRARPETLAKITDHAPHERAALCRAVQLGLPLAVGTDSGTTFNPHGWGMQEQAELLCRAGMAPEAVLRCLTVEGARLLGEPAGWLDVGRRADLLALEADPRQDISALHRVRGVVIRGHRVPLDG